MNLEHTRWPGYTSNKRAEISYATIQGKEALVQKFRNSSVMKEAPYCRPRTFNSWLDVVSVTPGIHYMGVGLELRFPEPDNNAKLQRSIENARAVGLYPPHSSGQIMEANRSLVTMWDRGTPQDQAELLAAELSGNLIPQRAASFVPTAYAIPPMRFLQPDEFSLPSAPPSTYEFTTQRNSRSSRRRRGRRSNGRTPDSTDNSGFPPHGHA